MTSSERKIINFLGEIKEKTNVRLVAQKTNLSSDYARLLCRALARSGHIKFENDLCHLLKRGRSRFENNDPAIEGPVAATANVTLLTDEPVVASQASDRNDEEENQGEDVGEDKDEDKSATSDEELDKVLADLEPSAKKGENEEADKPEESEKETEVAEEPKIENDAGKEEVRVEAKAEEPPPETPKENELPAEQVEVKTAVDTVEMKVEEKVEPQEIKETEVKAAESVTPPKDESAKPSGWSIKKIINWFAEKK